MTTDGGRPATGAEAKLLAPRPSSAVRPPPDGEPIGEIVETSTTQFLAQACELGRAPAFGSLVKVLSGPAEVFGLVSRVRTGGLEPGAQAVMRGRSGVRDAAIYHENPDLEAVLRRSPALHGVVRGLGHSAERLWQRARSGRS